MIKRAFFGGFSIYFFSSIINKGIPFFVLPVLTRFLTPTEFGIWATFQVMVTFSLPLVGFYTESNITRNFYRENQDFIARLVGSLLVIISTSVAILLGLLSIACIFFDNFFEIPRAWVFAIPLIGFATMVNQYNLTILRNRGMAKHYGVYEIGRTIINISIAITLIVCVGYSWEGMVYGLFLANLVFVVFSLRNLIKSKYLCFNYNLKIIKDTLKISIPLLPHAFGGVILSLSDRLFIGSMLSKADVGLYSVGCTLSMIVLLFTDAFNKTWSPWMYKNLVNIDDEKRRKIVKITYLYAISLVILAIVVCSSSDILLKIFVSTSYYGAKEYVAWTSFGFVAQGMYWTMFPYLMHEGKTVYLGIVTTFASIVNLSGNYFLIKQNGAIGAAQSTFISYMIMFLITWWISNKYFPMPWMLKKDNT